MSSLAAWFGDIDERHGTEVEIATVLLAVGVAFWSFRGRPPRVPSNHFSGTGQNNGAEKRPACVEELSSVDYLERVFHPIFRVSSKRPVDASLSGGWLLDGAVETAARTGHVWIMEKLVMLINSCLGVPTTAKMKEVMAVAYAYAGLVDKMEECFLHDCTGRMTQSAACCGAVVQGLLHCRRPDEALRRAKEMAALGYPICADLVTEIYRGFVRVGRVRDVMRQALPTIPPSTKAAKLILDYCQKAGDFALAREMYFMSLYIFEQQESTALCAQAQKAMLSMLAAGGDDAARPLFEKLQKSPQEMNEAFLLNLLSRSMESKFVAFAEQIVMYARETVGMSRPLYHASMKVYAAAHMFDKACDAYDQMLLEAVPTNASICSSVLWYATLCGREDIREDIMQSLAERTLRSHANKACMLQCLFATVAAASCLCLPGALGFMEAQDEKTYSPEGVEGHLGWDSIQDLLCVVRMMFGPLVIHLVAHAHPDAEEMDQWQDLLLDTLLI